MINGTHPSSISIYTQNWSTSTSCARSRVLTDLSLSLYPAKPIDQPLRSGQFVVAPTARATGCSFCCCYALVLHSTLLHVIALRRPIGRRETLRARKLFGVLRSIGACTIADGCAKDCSPVHRSALNNRDNHTTSRRTYYYEAWQCWLAGWLAGWLGEI